MRNGECAVMILAGGAATRLGASCPKGQFALQLGDKETCLFEILFSKLHNLGCPELIVMLSTATRESVDFLKAKNYFGYPEQKVHFTFQPEYPIISDNGQFLLDPHTRKLQTSPNGNGGFLKALESVEECIKGCTYLHVIGVDNPFVLPADPEMVGFASANGFEVVNRVLRPKVGEKVGIVGQRSIKPESQAPLCPGEI